MFNVNRAVLLTAVLLASQSTFAFGFSAASAAKSSASSLPRRNCRSLVLGSTPTTLQSEETAESTVDNDSKVNDIASQLLATCSEFGQIGSKLTDEERSIIDNLAFSLAEYTDPAPAQIDLDGRHELIYSAAPGASSGALGPLVGKVSQSFLDEERFINRVELLGGIVKIELNAERKVLDETRIRVKFKETAFYIFGNEVKRGEVKGAGVWDYVFSGSVNIDGEKMRLRVMKTPSTFIIVQKE